MNKDSILEVKKLHKRFTSKNITVKAVTDVSFNVSVQAKTDLRKCDQHHSRKNHQKSRLDPFDTKITV